MDVAPLLAQLDAHPELWGENSARQAFDGSPHQGTSDIWLRYARWTGDLKAMMAEHVPVWYPAAEALPAARDIALDLLAHERGEMLGGVLLTRISPGSGLKPHVDRGWHVDYYDKLYVCLQNDPDALFICAVYDAIEQLEPKVGEVWRFDNRKLHWVVNHSPRDRITLIVCTHSWMRQ